MAAAGSASSKIPKILAVVERWARQSGAQVSRATATSPDGVVEPVLRIMHGQIPVLAKTQGDLLVVFAIADVPKEVRDAAGKLTAADQLRLTMAFRDQLLSNPRAGFGTLPEALTTVAQLQRVTVERRLVVDEGSTVSHNIFIEAVQEVVVLIFRALTVLQIIDPNRSIPTSTAPPGPAAGEPPTAMYG